MIYGMKMMLCVDVFNILNRVLFLILKIFKNCN